MKWLTKSRSVVLGFLLALSTTLLFSKSGEGQVSIIINEVSQGSSGAQEFVEFLVTGPPIACTDIPQCIDLRGWVFDDNNGYLNGGPTTGVGIAQGACRFTNDPFWSCIPAGTVIVIYNDADPNTSLGPDDIDMADGDCALTIPISSNLFEHHPSEPSSSSSTYPTTGWVAGGNWTNISMSNSEDGFQIFDPGNLTTPVFSIGWGPANTNGDIYMGSSTASGDVFYLSDCNYMTQSSWIQGAAGTDETPGALNPGQATCVGAMNNNCADPMVSDTTFTNETCAGACDGTASVIVTGGVPPYTYNWSPAPGGGQGTPNVTGLCAGTYTVDVTDSNSPACVLTTSVTIIAGPSCCFIDSMFASIGACDPATGTYATTGDLYFTSPPISGQLIIEDCNGNQDVYNAPFTSPVNWTITGQTPDGLGCDVTATFTADPTCTMSIPYTAPVCNCNMDFLQVNIGSCDPSTDTYDLDGYVEFTSPPTTGQLIIEDCWGNQDVYNAPFTSPQTYTITGLPSDGGNCDVTAYFTADPTCTINLGGYTAPASCACGVGIGTFTAGINGNGTNQYVLCEGDEFFVNSNGDNTDPPDVNDPTITYDPGIWFLVYDCPPTIGPPDDINTDPCLIGVAGSTNGSFSVTNNGNGPDTLYYVPISMYSMVDGYYSATNSAVACYALGPVYEVVFLTPIVTTTAEDCQDSTVTVTISGGFAAAAGGSFTASNLSPASAYFVNNTTTNGGNIVVGGLVDGDMYSFDIVDDNGCPQTVSGGPFVGLDLVTVNPAGPFCDTDPTAAMSATPGGGAWSATCGACINSTGTFNPSTAGAGTHTIYYTSPGYCGNIDSTDIVVNAQFDATIDPAGPFCESDPVFTMTPTFDPGGTWSATCGACITSATGDFDPSVAGAGTHTITYTISGSCGDSQTTTVDVLPDADATIAPAGPLCESDPATTLTAAETGGTWTAACGACINSATGEFDPATAGAGTWQVIYEITGQCGDADTIDIVVNDQFDATIDPAGPFCESDPIFTMTPTFDPGGTWSATCGACITSSTGDFDPSVAGAGTHTITYTIAGNCGDTQTTSVIVNPDQDATINNPGGPFCLGFGTVTVTAVNPGGTWSATCGACINATSGVFDPAAAGIGNHTITYTLPNPCGDAQDVVIEVIDNFDATITQVGPFCEDDASVQLQAVDGGGTWSATCGACIDASGNFNPTVAGAGTHTITYDIPGSCGDSQTIDIVVEAVPVIDFTVDTADGCLPVTVTFTDNSTPAGTNCSWDFGDGTTSTDCGTTSHTYTDPGCFDVTLNISTAAGCSSSSTVVDMVCANPNAVAGFNWGPQDASVFDPTINFTNTSINADSYVWDFNGEGSSTATNPSYTFSDENPGTYVVCLEANNSFNCPDTICRTILIRDEFVIYVPNAFTPDDDGINDLFLPILRGHDPETYQLWIFDRWGHIVFETQHDGEAWDGTVNGVVGSEKTDTYVWKIQVKDQFNKKHEFYGHVTLLR